MKKLTKDQLQKIILSSLMMVGLIYCYFTFLIAGLNKGDDGANAGIADLDTQDRPRPRATIKTQRGGRRGIGAFGGGNARPGQTT